MTRAVRLPSLLAALLVASLLGLPPAQAASLCVTTTADSGPGSLRQAIVDANAAPGADSICFDLAGSGMHTIALLTQLPDLGDDLAIDGTTQAGWAAGAPVVELHGGRSEDPPFGASVDWGLVVAGGGVTVRGLGLRGFGHSAIDVKASSSLVALEHLHVHHNGMTDAGGALRVRGGSTSVSDSLFEENVAETGGAVHLLGGTTTIADSRLERNDAPAGGGGIYIDGGSNTFTDTTFSDNTASTGAGGIYVLGGSNEFTRVAVERNSAVNGGGAVLRGSGLTTFTGSTIDGNVAGGDGGGVLVLAGTNQFTDTTLAGNSAGGSGGGAFLDLGVNGFTRVLLQGNEASYGGAIHVGNGATTVTDSLLDGNQAIQGGGVIVYGGTNTFAGTTLSGNTATSKGGGAYVAGGSTTFGASRVEGNSAPEGGGTFRLSGVLSLVETSVEGNQGGPSQRRGATVSAAAAMTGLDSAHAALTLSGVSPLSTYRIDLYTTPGCAADAQDTETDGWLGTLDVATDGLGAASGSLAWSQAGAVGSQVTSTATLLSGGDPAGTAQPAACSLLVEAPAACGDEVDNDGDTLVDFPDDPHCTSPADDDEGEPKAAPTACENGLDDDGDRLADFPDDPGCLDAADDDETDPPVVLPACSNGLDDDRDGAADFPDDSGCLSATDDSERNANVECDDGLDNDRDRKVDFPADPGCRSATDDRERSGGGGGGGGPAADDGPAPDAGTPPGSAGPPAAPDPGGSAVGAGGVGAAGGDGSLVSGAVDVGAEGAGGSRAPTAWRMPTELAPAVGAWPAGLALLALAGLLLLAWRRRIVVTSFEATADPGLFHVAVANRALRRTAIMSLRLRGVDPAGEPIEVSLGVVGAPPAAVPLGRRQELALLVRPDGPDGDAALTAGSRWAVHVNGQRGERASAALAA